MSFNCVEWNQSSNNYFHGAVKSFLFLPIVHLHTEKMRKWWWIIQGEDDETQEQETQVDHRQLQLQQPIKEAEAMLAGLWENFLRQYDSNDQEETWFFK